MHRDPKQRPVRRHSFRHGLASAKILTPCVASLFLYSCELALRFRHGSIVVAFQRGRDIARHTLKNADTFEAWRLKDHFLPDECPKIVLADRRGIRSPPSPIEEMRTPQSSGFR